MRRKIFSLTNYCLIVVLLILTFFSTPAFALEGEKINAEFGDSPTAQQASGGASVINLLTRKVTPTPNPEPEGSRNVSGGGSSGDGSSGSDLPGRHSEAGVVGLQINRLA